MIWGNLRERIKPYTEQSTTGETEDGRQSKGGSSPRTYLSTVNFWHQVVEVYLSSMCNDPGRDTELEIRDLDDPTRVNNHCY